MLLNGFTVGSSVININNEEEPYLPGEGDVLFADGAPVKIHLVDCWWVVSGVFWVRVGCGVGCSLFKQTELKKNNI